MKRGEYDDPGSQFLYYHYNDSADTQCDGTIGVEAILCHSRIDYSRYDPCSIRYSEFHRNDELGSIGGIRRFAWNIVFIGQYPDVVLHEGQTEEERTRPTGNVRTARRGCCR